MSPVAKTEEVGSVTATETGASCARGIDLDRETDMVAGVSKGPSRAYMRMARER